MVRKWWDIAHVDVNNNSSKSVSPLNRRYRDMKDLVDHEGQSTIDDYLDYLAASKGLLMWNEILFGCVRDKNFRDLSTFELDENVVYPRLEDYFTFHKYLQYLFPEYDTSVLRAPNHDVLMETA